MCVFATQDDNCILQKLNRKNYEFKESDRCRGIERAHRFYASDVKDDLVKKLSKKYSCYRPWEIRETEADPWSGERVDHWSEKQFATSLKCLDEDRGIIASNCPKFNGTRLCQPYGWSFPDPQCPLLKDHTWKMSAGHLYITRHVVAPKEIAYKIRTISKRRVECDAAYNIALRLTWKQAVLWYLRMLGKAAPDVHEMEIIAEVNRKHFTNTLFGVPKGNGYREGGAVSKVEKVLRHKGFDDKFIKAFCLEAFSLISLDFHRPAIYLELLKRKPKEASLTDIEWGCWIDGDPVWTWKAKDED